MTTRKSTVTVTVTSPPVVAARPVGEEWDVSVDDHWPTYRLRVSIGDWHAEIEGWVACGHLAEGETRSVDGAVRAVPAAGGEWDCATSDGEFDGTPGVQFDDDDEVTIHPGANLSGTVVTVPAEIVARWPSAGEAAEAIEDAIEDAVPFPEEPTVDDRAKRPGKER